MRRKLAYVGFFVLLGLAVHLAVVVLCAMLINVDRHQILYGSSRTNDQVWLAEVIRAPGAMRISSSTHNSNSDLLKMLTRYGLPPQDIRRSELPQWSRVHSDPAMASGLDFSIIAEDARGWPLQSLYCEFDDYHIRLARNQDETLEVLDRDGDVLTVRYRTEFLNEVADVGADLPATMNAEQEFPIVLDNLVRGGLLLPMEGTNFNGEPTIYVLPLTPSWPEFLINTAFYTLAAWLLIAWPRKLLRRDRNDRGECEACGYPIGESPVCTECGAALAPEERRTVATGEAARSAKPVAAQPVDDAAE